MSQIVSAGEKNKREIRQALSIYRYKVRYRFMVGESAGRRTRKLGGIYIYKDRYRYTSIVGESHVADRVGWGEEQKN